jgi:CRISPR-associated protein Csx17
LPLEALTGFEAQAKDLALVVAGGVDLTRTVWLARALSPLEPHRLLERGPLRHGPDDLSELDPVWGALRLSHLVAPLSDGRRFTLDPAIVRTLTAGDLSRAFELARVRLSGGGLRLPLRGAIGDGATAHRIAASLAFPISRKLSDRIARELDPQSARRAQEMTHVR